ncbi:MAG: hypothetical protein JXR46_11935 [Calditrichaceae bacterium]|nr:hypothetical protein [Calditrichaceae bacterium]MBN2709745.1 hypothetical protein [Calditrichaceae bacterium]RQV94939.1 MAG: hypothetical protein EH224_08685 [Calditrichota bacterium]
MKNRLFVLIPILLVSIFNGGSLQAGEKNIALKAGIDFFSDHKIENGMTTDVKISYSLASELHFNHSDLIRYGFGIAYQIPREQLIEGETGKKFSFFPVYALCEINFLPHAAMNPALIINAGYNFFTANNYYRGQNSITGGVYLGGGISLSLHENFRVELFYRFHQGSVDQNNLKVNYTTCAFNICAVL